MPLCLLEGHSHLVWPGHTVCSCHTRRVTWELCSGALCWPLTLQAGNASSGLT